MLCEDALTLNKFLFDSPLCNSETKALQALMLFNIARFDARFDAMAMPWSWSTKTEIIGMVH